MKTAGCPLKTAAQCGCSTSGQRMNVDSFWLAVCCVEQSLSQICLQIFDAIFCFAIFVMGIRYLEGDALSADIDVIPEYLGIK